PALAAPVLSAPARPARAVAPAPPAKVPAAPVSLTPVQVLSRAAEQAAVEPENIGRLYDQAPAGPDFNALTAVKAPAAPAAWRPSSGLLKPAAAAVNAWRGSRHQKRLSRLGPGERVTTEELGMRQTLSQAHEALVDGRLQDALEELSRLFKGAKANRWYRANSAYRPYQRQGHGYIRFVERAVKLAYERAHGRARDAALIAEARAAARDGSLLGHEWRTTAVQDRGSAHCAHHALFNAISASVGFAYPLSVHRFIERARETLNVRAETLTGRSGSELRALEHSLGVKLGSDVGEGMGPESIRKWALLLGMSFEARGPPRGDAQWSAMLGRGREVLISLRMFHERFQHAPERRDLEGHDYETIHHEVYLLGAFDSPSRGARLYMVQDSGSGATDFYTAEELSAVASEIQVVGAPSRVALP
ncbi:MAG: hypothetical protein NUW21_04255, partial [Elusimicrobia bacterium]|nr:hypothetical protein [Elusimicrobiota bacterium]